MGHGFYVNRETKFTKTVQKLSKTSRSDQREAAVAEWPTEYTSHHCAKACSNIHQKRILQATMNADVSGKRKTIVNGSNRPKLQQPNIQ